MIAFEAVLYPNHVFQLLKTTFTLTKPKRVIITILDDDDDTTSINGMNGVLMPLSTYANILQASHAYSMTSDDLSLAQQRSAEMETDPSLGIDWDVARAQLVKDGILHA